MSYSWFQWAGSEGSLRPYVGGGSCAPRWLVRCQAWITNPSNVFTLPCTNQTVICDCDWYLLLNLTWICTSLLPPSPSFSLFVPFYSLFPPFLLLLLLPLFLHSLLTSSLPLLPHFLALLHHFCCGVLRDTQVTSCTQ